MHIDGKSWAHTNDGAMTGAAALCGVGPLARRVALAFAILTGRSVGIFALTMLCSVAADVSAADADGLNLEPHAGPVAWLEEHWDVKPEKLDDFVATYEREVYSLARGTPGYRGYTMYTSIPGEEERGPPRATAYQGKNTELGGSDHFITHHPGIWLEGKVLTERSVNVGAALGRTYNVIVVHHHQTWADAERFAPEMARLYAQANDGRSLDEHLSTTLYTLVNNVWDARYRLVKTGYPGTALVRRTRDASATDVDGLDLEPHPGPKVVIEEHWDIAPENVPAFFDAYEREVYSTIRQIQGYRGYTTFTSVASSAEPAVPLPLGPGAEFYVSRPGMLLDGEVRTDRAINAGAMFRITFNVKVLHYLDNWVDSDNFGKGFNRIYAQAHGGVLPWSRFAWTERLMRLARNHWDMYYRVLRISFQPGPAPQPTSAVATQHRGPH